MTGFAMVEESGYIHKVHLNGGNYPELDAELKRVVRLSQRWTPASVEDIAVTSDRTVYRYIRQSVPHLLHRGPGQHFNEQAIRDGPDGFAARPLRPAAMSSL